MPASRMAKYKTLCQQLAVGFALLPLTALDATWLWNGFLWAAVVLAVVSGVQYFCRARTRPEADRAREGSASMRCESGRRRHRAAARPDRRHQLGVDRRAAGCDRHRHRNVHVKVGDNVARIEGVLRQLLAEADAVIVCGGLGPTHDDLTREAIAAVMGGVGARARRVGRRRDRRAVRRTRVGAMTREQPAPGDGAGGGHGHPATARDRAGVDLPGHGRRDGEGDLRRSRGADGDAGDGHPGRAARACSPAAGEHEVIRSRVLKVWGESESGLNARLDDVIERLDVAGDPTLAFLARGWNGLEIRLTSRRPDAARGARRRSRPGRRRSASASASSCSASDDDSMESVVLDLLRERGLVAGPRRVADGGADLGPAGRHLGCERRAARRRRVVRQRGQVRPARRAGRSGDQRGGGAGDGRRRPAGARRRRRRGAHRRRRSA